MRHRIVVLGAGYAGAPAAGYLARHLHPDDVGMASNNETARSVGAAAVGLAGLGLLLVTITRLRAGTREPTG